MEKEIKSRMMIAIIGELARELDIDVSYFCQDWIIQLGHNGGRTHIVGYDWDLNSAAAQLLAKDKAGCYEILNAHGVPTVECALFLHPSCQDYTSPSGSWERILEYAEQYEYNLICKPNFGTGGADVYRTHDRPGLEKNLQELFSRHLAICLSPFLDICNEYRVIVLNGKAELAYQKQRPFVIGDGQADIVTLAIRKYGPDILQHIDLEHINLTNIPFYYDDVGLTWKHNLSKGAQAILVEDEFLKAGIGRIALRAAEAINLNFGAVDIVEANGKFNVLEVNSGVMMEKFSQQGSNEYGITKAIYKKALRASIDHCPLKSTRQKQV